jgi:hypothetical protein
MLLSTMENAYSVGGTDEDAMGEMYSDENARVF